METATKVDENGALWFAAPDVENGGGRWCWGVITLTGASVWGDWLSREDAVGAVESEEWRSIR